MGKYYARAAGHDDGVPEACEMHYTPLGPSDDVPTAPRQRRRGAGRQDRHADRLLGDRRKADGVARTPMRCAGRRWGLFGLLLIEDELADLLNRMLTMHRAVKAADANATDA